jgi:hypothetical protein
VGNGDELPTKGLRTADEPVFPAELRAIERLGWTPQEPLLAAIRYGDVGTVEDVAEHLRTGDHLPPGQQAIIAAALWDAEVAALEA